MRKVILFTASSMDGFIAGPHEEIDWLFTDQDYGYLEFYNSIDTTLMGYKTYKLCESFPEFPYPDKENFVFTRNTGRTSPFQVTFINENVAPFVRDLKSLPNRKDIMLVGGGQINHLLAEEDLIDEIVLSIHPVALGKGISLFDGQSLKRNFKTVSAKTFDSGLVQIRYERKM